MSAIKVEEYGRKKYERGGKQVGTNGFPSALSAIALSAIALATWAYLP